VPFGTVPFNKEGGSRGRTSVREPGSDQRNPLFHLCSTTLEPLFSLLNGPFHYQKDPCNTLSALSAPYQFNTVALRFKGYRPLFNAGVSYALPIISTN